MLIILYAIPNNFISRYEKKILLIPKNYTIPQICDHHALCRTLLTMLIFTTSYGSGKLEMVARRQVVVKTKKLILYNINNNLILKINKTNKNSQLLYVK